MQQSCSKASASVLHCVRPKSAFTQGTPAHKGVSRSVPERLRVQYHGRRFCVKTASAHRKKLPSVTQPSSCNDVDRDLWTVLDLASDDELEGLHDILFGEP